MIYEVFLALGSNMGDRENNLNEAIKGISHIPQTSVERVSGIYETEPVGYTGQDKFLNMAASVRTRLEPLGLLKELQAIEKFLKRTREIHWGPRTIDIDILLYGDQTVDLPDLQIPHPRMFERAFVLVPLKEVYPYKAVFGRDMGQLISKCDDAGGVKLYK